MRRIGIVNRGEAAVRFLAALEAMRFEEADAPESVALYTDADAGALFVRRADHARRIGAGRGAYLDPGGVVAALLESGCDAAWLGWGFASEDATFARALEAAGITLLAPRPETMEALGDKIRAKQLAERCEVPVAPWAIVETPEAAEAASAGIGFPLLVKAAGGGGGRGIRRVDRVDEVAAAFTAARAEAERSFASAGIMLELCVEGARHVEVQVLGDGEGEVVVLGLRDCSLQRRRQKVLEECPAPHLSDRAQAILVGAARRLCTEVRYRSAGTVEFLFDPTTERAYFLEVNTRLQVEHPVTELVHGVDLVRAQIDLARGGPLPQGAPRGWAIEVRVCAEDAQRGFVPAPGKLVRFAPPVGPGIRVDTGFVEGDAVSPEFDALIAKIIAWGPNRAAALGRLASALDQTRIVIEGGTTNVAFLRGLLDHPDVRGGTVDTGLIDRMETAAPSGAGVAALAAAIDRFLAAGDLGSGLDRHRVEVGDNLSVYRVASERFEVVGALGAICVDRQVESPLQVTLTIDGVAHRVELAPGDTTCLVDGVPHRVPEASGGAVSSPSAALVLDIPVQPGDRVEADACVAVVESMKMEVRIATPRAGVVREVRIAAGEHAQAGQVLLVVEPEGAAGPVAGLDEVPWGAPAPGTAAQRLRDAVVGWDVAPERFAADCAALTDVDVHPLLEAFADVAELFERRPVTNAENGAAAAVAPTLWLETLRRRGPEGLDSAQQLSVERALAHHGITDLSAGIDAALLRLERAGQALPRLARAVLAALDVLTPVRRRTERLLDRLAGLDPERLETVAEAADLARYHLIERPAVERQCRRADALAGALLARLEAGDATWDELLAAPESLLTGTARRAAEGCPLATELIARRLEWHDHRQPVEGLRVGDRPACRVGEGAAARVVIAVSPATIAATLDAASALPALARLDVVVVADGGDPQALLDAAEAHLDHGPAPWETLCLMAVTGPHLPAVRRYHGRGAEVPVCRDLLPSTVHRYDLRRLERFDFERLPADAEVVLFRARARSNPQDERLLAYGEIRSLERAPGSPLRFPHVERVFHGAVRALHRARETLDPRRRLHWNRITLVVLPVVPMTQEILQTYVARLAPSAERVGLEKVVIRARFAEQRMPSGVTPWMDLSVFRACGRVQMGMAPASRDPLAPVTPFESSVVLARRRGVPHPYEIIRLLESGGQGIPSGRFEELDLDPRGRLISVAGRGPGENRAAVVLGRVSTRVRGEERRVRRIAIISDPTRHMGALAEPECRRILAALDLAARERLPVEWTAVSAGARIDMQTGTENLDWTARVLRRIVEFTEAGGEINILVPGICVGAQAYWNAEATMLMHTRGLLVMTDRGSMVLTGKRALDISGCVSAEDDLALGGYTTIMGPNGQAQAYAQDLAAAMRLLWRYYQATYVHPEDRRPVPRPTTDPDARNIGESPYPAALAHGFETVGELFSVEHNQGRKRPFAVRPILRALMDADSEPVERWGGMRDAETAVIWETRIGGYAATLIGIENRPVKRLGALSNDGPAELAGGTLYPQAARKIARALNAASGKRPAVVIANLSGFDGSPESLARWQLEYGAEIGRAVVKFDGPIVFAVVSRYHGGAYVVFSKALNEKLTAVALEGSYASVIGGAPAAAVVFSREVKRRAQADGGDKAATARATAAVAAEFDAVHTVDRARQVGSIDDIIAPATLRPYVIDVLRRDAEQGLNLVRTAG